MRTCVENISSNMVRIRSVPFTSPQTEKDFDQIGMCHRSWRRYSVVKVVIRLRIHLRLQNLVGSNRVQEITGMRW